jgi:hypothetical protein
MKYAALIRHSACKGIDQKLVWYGQIKEPTPNIKLSTKAIFLELYISIAKRNMTTEISEIIIELKKRAMTGIGEIENELATR